MAFSLGKYYIHIFFVIVVPLRSKSRNRATMLRRNTRQLEKAKSVESRSAHDQDTSWVASMQRYPIVNVLNLLFTCSFEEASLPWLSVESDRRSLWRLQGTRCKRATMSKQEDLDDVDTHSSTRGSRKDQRHGATKVCTRARRLCELSVIILLFE